MEGVEVAVVIAAPITERYLTTASEDKWPTESDSSPTLFQYNTSFSKRMRGQVLALTLDEWEDERAFDIDQLIYIKLAMT